MPRNRYISHGTRSEKHLYEDIIIEAMQIYGHDVYYMPRAMVRLDTILNEDVLSQFEHAFKIEMYVESVDGFEGDGKLMNKFGFEFRDQVTFVVANRRWNQLIGRYGYTQDSVRPREGDLIYVPLTKGLFEIRFVEDKKPFYQASQVPTFKLTCENFEYSNQKINTSVPEVDAIESQLAQSQTVRVTFADEDVKFAVGENINISNADGVLIGYTELLSYTQIEINGADKIAVRLAIPTYVDEKFRRWSAGTVLSSSTSAAVATIDEVYDKSSINYTTFENDLNAQNDSFETIGNSYIDFSMSNPFGEPDQ